MDDETLNRKFQKELNAGASSLVILGLLARSGRAMYGYEIGKRLEELAGSLPMHQGALYPTLRSLERGGLLASEVEPSVAGPPRRYYRITPQGQQSLADWTAAWSRTKQFVDAVLEDSHGSNNAPSGAGNPEVSDGARNEPAQDAGNVAGRRSGRRARVLTE